MPDLSKGGQNACWVACFHFSDKVFAFADSIKSMGTNGDAVPVRCNRLAVMFIRPMVHRHLGGFLKEKEDDAQA